MLVGGFVGGHVLDAVVYRPDEVLRRPLWLFEIWNGQGSSGGFAGALLDVLAWKHFKHRGTEPILPYADLVLSVFPVAWVFGRMGCAVAHDHPGVRADLGAPLAVAYGPFDPSDVTRLALGIELRNGTAPRYDLGTLELFVTVAIALVVMATWRKKLPVGSYVALVALAYPPARFAMEFLRAPDRDPRYWLLTPAQWASLALFAFGLFWVVRLRRTWSWNMAPGGH
jgi:phosphatidylglycerol:prolipoprotein diacylglycerol transferase